jgi:hypothetical protein
MPGCLKLCSKTNIYRQSPFTSGYVKYAQIIYFYSISFILLGKEKRKKGEVFKTYCSVLFGWWWLLLLLIACELLK